MSSNVLEMLIEERNKYIILITGLKFSPIENIINALAKDFNAIVLNYMHFNHNDDYNIINERVKEIYNNKKPIFIITTSFASDEIKIPLDFHLHISLNKFMANELNPVKDDNFYDDYKKKLETNRINKYYNLKKDWNMEQATNDIFYIIIDNIEKKLYGDKYEELASNPQPRSGNKNVEPRTGPSIYGEAKKGKMIMLYDKKAKSDEEKMAEQNNNIIKEIHDEIDEQSSPNTSDSAISSNIRLM